MNSYEYAVDGAGELMADPNDLGSNLGILGSIGTGVAVAVGWGVNLAMKRMGLTATTAAEANAAAQKDMLDWQKEQLRDEVARREKAEDQVQSLLIKLNEVTTQMSRLEQQNQTLQSQVQTLTETVANLKASVVGTTANAS